MSYSLFPLGVFEILPAGSSLFPREEGQCHIPSSQGQMGVFQEGQYGLPAAAFQTDAPAESSSARTCCRLPGSAPEWPCQTCPLRSAQSPADD